MEKEENHTCKGCKNWNAGGCGGAVYGLGFVGALIYFIGHATSFGSGVFGIFKAIVWPALLVYRAMEMFAF